MSRPRLVVLLGPTGVGKTDLSISLAKYLGSPILSADSRQLFRELPIGTAAPNDEQRQQCPHYFVSTKSVQDYYSASLYESEVLSFLEEWYQTHSNALVVGGSMMYLEAVISGIDDMPDVLPEVREAVYQRYASEGLEGILQELEQLDPIYFGKVDKLNYKRVLHGYEVCLSTGKPFSSFLTGRKRERPFDTIQIGLIRPLPELYHRIDQRVLMMMEQGLEEEARQVYPYRHLNALNTVGYKELFAYFDGMYDRTEAVRLIQRNSRHYARKQLSWWRRNPNIRWFHPEEQEQIIEYLEQKLQDNGKILV